MTIRLRNYFNDNSINKPCQRIQRAIYRRNYIYFIIRKGQSCLCIFGRAQALESIPLLHNKLLYVKLDIIFSTNLHKARKLVTILLRRTLFNDLISIHILKYHFIYLGNIPVPNAVTLLLSARVKIILSFISLKKILMFFTSCNKLLSSVQCKE